MSTSTRSTAANRNRRSTTTPHVTGPWLNADQLAIYLSLPSPGAARELERRGVLPGHRLGGSLRFSRPEIDNLLLQTRQATIDDIAGGIADDDVSPIAMPPNGLGPFLNPEEAVVYLGLPSPDALNHRVRRGELPCYRIGRQLRFRAQELDAVMKDDRGHRTRGSTTANRQLTFGDLARTVGHGRPPVEEGGN